VVGEMRAGRLVHIPIHEFSRHTQRLMLVENQRRPNALASVFSEKLKSLIAEAEYAGPVLTPDAAD